MLAGVTLHSKVQKKLHSNPNLSAVSQPVCQGRALLAECVWQDMDLPVPDELGTWKRTGFGLKAVTLSRTEASSYITWCVICSQTNPVAVAGGADSRGGSNQTGNALGQQCWAVRQQSLNTQLACSTGSTSLSSEGLETLTSTVPAWLCFHFQGFLWSNKCGRKGKEAPLC